MIGEKIKEIASKKKKKKKNASGITINEIKYFVKVIKSLENRKSFTKRNCYKNY